MPRNEVCNCIQTVSKPRRNDATNRLMRFVNDLDSASAEIVVKRPARLALWSRNARQGEGEHYARPIVAVRGCDGGVMKIGDQSHDV